jgi:3-carboxy-cis,cis-muconate cycloisomerase
LSYSLGTDALLNSLNSDLEMEAFLSQGADLRAMLKFERFLAVAQEASHLIPKGHAQIISDHIDELVIDQAALMERFTSDGVAPPALISQLIHGLDCDVASSLHFGVTSQDLIDTSLMLRIKSCVELMLLRLSDLLQSLDEMADIYSDDRVLAARTRMQNALPISVPEKLQNWRSHILDLLNSQPSYFPLQLGGPEGAARKFAPHYVNVVQKMAELLDLDDCEYQWHTNRQSLNDIAFWMCKTATATGKIAQDVLMMVQSDVGEVKLASFGQSSAMPHKQNPVLAEVIVAQARFCQVQMNGMNFSSLHENERSGTAWTLEWMLLPLLVRSCGSSIKNTQTLLNDLTFKA